MNDLTVRRNAFRHCGTSGFVSDVRLPNQRRTNPMVPMTSVAISTVHPYAFTAVRRDEASAARGTTPNSIRLSAVSRTVSRTGRIDHPSSRRAFS